jgi:hypothetical protein
MTPLIAMVNATGRSGHLYNPTITSPSATNARKSQATHAPAAVRM